MRATKSGGNEVATGSPGGGGRRKGAARRTTRLVALGATLVLAPMALASGTWAVETVSPILGTLSPLAYDGQGNPSFACRVSYTASASAPKGSVLYVTRTGSGWTTETVESTGGGRAYLAYDPSGAPSMAYGRAKQSKKDKDRLVLAVRTGAGWTQETVEETSGAPSALGFAYDASGNACALYTRPEKGGSTRTLRFATRSGGAWIRETVDTSVGLAALALDGSGTPCAAYLKGGSLYFAGRGVGGWSTQVVASAGTVGVSLAFDPVSGDPAIAYTDPVDNFAVRYASWNGIYWETEMVDADGGGSAALAFDSSGVPAIGNLALPVSGTYETRVARRGAAGWSYETIDTCPDGSSAEFSLGVRNDVVSILYPWADLDAGVPGETRYATESP